MPAFSFKKQFVEPIQAGTKHHTIRTERKDGRIPAKVGDKLSLYCGMRTKGCFRILAGTVPCTKVEQIYIGLPRNCGLFHPYVFIGPVRLASDECESLAKADGFSDFNEMMMFWEGRLPFKGFIIHWK